MRQINMLAIHCSDSCDSLDIGVNEIDQWHKERGWSGVGYHYVIRRDGTVEVGREIEQVGAHVKGYNSNSIGICWVGRNKPSKDQMKSLYWLLFDLMKEYGLNHENVWGHYELDAHKTCPNLDMDRVRANLVFPDEPIDFLKESYRVVDRSEDE